MNQKGLTEIVVILVIGVLVLVGSYFIWQKSNISSVVPSPSPIASPNSNSSPTQEVEIVSGQQVEIDNYLRIVAGNFWDDEEYTDSSGNKKLGTAGIWIYPKDSELIHKRVYEGEKFEEEGYLFEVLKINYQFSENTKRGGDMSSFVLKITKK